MSKPIKSLLIPLIVPGWMLSTTVHCELNDDVSVELTSSQPRYDAVKRRFVVAGRLINHSNAAIQAPISLAIDSFNPASHSVDMQNPDGTLPDGEQYKVLYPQGGLGSGAQADFEFYLAFSNPISPSAVTALEKVAQKVFKFQTLTNAQFSFDYHLLRIPAGNHQPTADAGVDRVGAVGGAVLLDGSFSADADNDPISFAWKLDLRPSGSLAVLTETETVSPSLIPDIPGTYQASLIVSDGYVASQADSVSIVIDAAPGLNQKPKITSTPPTSGTATMSFNYQVKAGDPDGDSLIFRLVDHPVGMTISASGKLEWLVPDTPHEIIPVTLEVDDARGGVTEQKFSFHIMPCVCP